MTCPNEVPRRRSILVVDDEANIVDVVAGALRLDGFEVHTAGTAADALALARHRRPALLILDVRLPDVDGFEICRRLLAEGNRAPVLFLTARTDGATVAEGLVLGGDDYVRKPFHLVELVARVRALLRRSGGAGIDEPSRLAFMDLELDLDRHQASRADVVLDLTPTEYRMLEVLLRHAGRVLTKGQLVDLVWDDRDPRDPATVETVVSRLRRKIDVTGPELLATRRGVGYGLIAPDQG